MKDKPNDSTAIYIYGTIFSTPKNVLQTLLFENIDHQNLYMHNNTLTVFIQALFS